MTRLVGQRSPGAPATLDTDQQEGTVVQLIVSQGRIGDRVPGLIAGAAHTAAALARVHRTEARSVGVSSPPVHDDWISALDQARPTLTGLRDATRAALDAGGPVVLAMNTCSASIATLPVVAAAHPRVRILWIDAHGDFHIPSTTTSAYLGGMVLAGVCGLWDTGYGAGIRGEHVVVVGARDIDEPEAVLLDRAGAEVVAPAAVDPAAVMALTGDDPVWVHIDWDVLEPGHVPADYRIPGGLLPAQVRAVLAAIPPRRLVGVELAEFRAPADGQEVDAALAHVLDVVGPVFDPARAVERLDA